MNRWQWLGVFVSLSGCFPFMHPVVVSDFSGRWDSRLNDDLRVAVADFDRELQGSPIRMRWAGVLGQNYEVLRDPAGNPLRQWVEIVYVFTYPERHKCYRNYVGSSAEYLVVMAREHLGGGQYGPPRIAGMSPLNERNNPRGQEAICSAADGAVGGIHLGGESTETLSAAAPAPSVSAKTNSQATEQDQTAPVSSSLSALVPGVGPFCRQYAQAACTNPTIPATVDRQSFCAHLVTQTNADAASPGAEKACKTKLKNTQHK